MKVKYLKYYICAVFLLVFSAPFIIYYSVSSPGNNPINTTGNSPATWHAPNIDLLPATPEADLIRYGRDLIANTSTYLGPKGSVAILSNGLNCQNCHLDAGAKPYGGCFASVASTYPKFRNRSGRFETVEYRINECMERSLNGKKLDSLSKEMRAMVAYIKWVGKDVPKGENPAGIGTIELDFMSRAADTVAGKSVFNMKCKSCHGANGEGVFKPDSAGYIYPPLWGPNSYNLSAGMYRLARLAEFVKDNMPFGATHVNSQLGDDEAWDVAAFINSQQRPKKFFSKDWPDISTKPVDHPFGPYADSFSEIQHKYGPFDEIVKARAKKAQK